MNYRTFDEIKNDTIKNGNAGLWYRGFDFIRAQAFTRFIEERSAQPGFRFVCGKPLNLRNRDAGTPDEVEATKEFSLGLWAGWMEGEDYFYLQIDSNPFFEAYVSRSVQSGKAMRTTRLMEINDILYKGVEWDTSAETSAKLLENLRACLEFARQDRRLYNEEIRSYMNPFTRQDVYFR